MAVRVVIAIRMAMTVETAKERRLICIGGLPFLFRESNWDGKNACIRIGDSYPRAVFHECLYAVYINFKTGLFVDQMDELYR